MRISVTEAKAQLTDLVRRAEAGEEVVLTRHGHEAARIVPSGKVRDPQAFRAMIRELQDSAAANMKPGTDSTSNHDYLYDENGLPG